MLGRHQHTSPKETTLISMQWKKLHPWHTAEKRRLKRAMNKRLRRCMKQDALQNADA